MVVLRRLLGRRDDADFQLCKCKAASTVNAPDGPVTRLLEKLFPL